jgi:hypothetical protein
MPRLRSLLPTSLLALALLAPGAQAAPDRATEAEAIRALEAAESALSIQRRGAGGAPSREATALLRDLAVALPALDGAERRRAAGLLARPTDNSDRDYFGPEAPASPTCTTDFCVHWTNRAENAPMSAQYVNQVVLSMQKTFQVENGDLGWRKPKPDGNRGQRNGKGKNGQIDVYITNLGPQLYGFAAPDPGQTGAKRFAYLVIDNDYQGFPNTPVQSMQVTVAHEFNHILQFNYDTLEDLWMFESTATWMEEQVYPEINDYLNYLPAWSQAPDAPMIGKTKVYADSVWNHWLTSKLGADVVRDAWAASSEGVKPAHDAVASYNESIDAAGGRSLSRQFATLAARSAEWRSSDAFPDAEVYPDIDRKGRLAKGGKRLKLDGTAYQLYDVGTKTGQKAKLSVKAAKGTDSAIALVGREGPIGTGEVEVASRYLGGGGKGKVKLKDTGFERVTAVVINAEGKRNKSGKVTADNSRYEVRLKKKR